MENIILPIAYLIIVVLASVTGIVAWYRGIRNERLVQWTCIAIVLASTVAIFVASIILHW